MIGIIRVTLTRGEFTSGDHLHDVAANIFKHEAPLSQRQRARGVEKYAKDITAAVVYDCIPRPGSYALFLWLNAKAFEIVVETFPTLFGKRWGNIKLYTGGFMFRQTVDPAASRAEVKLMSKAVEQLKQIFDEVEKEAELKTQNVPSMVVEVLAKSANGRRILFEVKSIPPGRTLGYSAYLSMAAIKEAIEGVSPEAPPIVAILTSGPVEEPVRSFLAQQGTPVVSLAPNVTETKARLRKAFEQLGIKLPELAAEGDMAADKKRIAYQPAI